MHLTAELVGRFLLRREAFNVICLSSNPALLTAWANGYTYDTVFSRQVEAYGEPGAGDEHENHLAYGERGGKLAPLSDYLFAVPSSSTPLIQQTHVCLYHYLCAVIEEELAECGSTET